MCSSFVITTLLILRMLMPTSCMLSLKSKPFRSTILDKTMNLYGEKQSKSSHTNNLLITDSGNHHKNQEFQNANWYCEKFSECFSCTQNTQCRYCLMKKNDSSHFLIENKTTTEQQLKGRCIDIQTTVWNRPFPITQNPTTYAYCGLIFPDYTNGLTCIDVTAGSNFKTYREKLETIQPIAMPFSAAQNQYPEDTTLERVLEYQGGFSSTRLPVFALFVYGAIILVIFFAFCLCLFLFWHGCKFVLSCCCCCCYKNREKSPILLPQVYPTTVYNPTTMNPYGYMSQAIS